MNKTTKVTPRIKVFSNIKAQGGWTFWSLSFTLGTIMFFAYVFMQLVPVYNQNQNIVNAMHISVDGADLKKVNRSQIIKKMNGQLYLDGSHELLDYKKDLKITRSRSDFTLAVDYERKVPLFFNVSVLAEFAPRVKCDFNGVCETSKIKSEDDDKK